MKRPLILLLTLALPFCAVSADGPFPAPERSPKITDDPAGAKSYTIYKLADDAVRKKQAAIVQRITGNGSFASRVLTVISDHGHSKEFTTITGEDGLTFGIKDFTSGGVHPLLALIEERFPGAVALEFGAFAPQAAHKAWLDQHTSAADDHGLVAETGLRVGLDRVLCNPRYRGAQLARFRAETLDPALAEWKKRGWKLEFSLAAMCGVINSTGPGGLKGLDAAATAVGSDAEDKVIRQFLLHYVGTDAKQFPTQDKAAIAAGFDGSPAMPDGDHLDHHARRARLLFAAFPWKDQKPFDGDLGDFALEAGEQLPPKP